MWKYFRIIVLPQLHIKKQEKKQTKNKKSNLNIAQVSPEYVRLKTYRVLSGHKKVYIVSILRNVVTVLLLKLYQIAIWLQMFSNAQKGSNCCGFFIWLTPLLNFKRHLPPFESIYREIYDKCEKKETKWYCFCLSNFLWIHFWGYG